MVELAGQLRLDGVTAAGVAADIRDSDARRGAIERLADELGPVEVLEYAPLPAPEYMKPVLETTVADVRGPLEFSVLGAVAATQAIIGPMRDTGRGTTSCDRRGGGKPVPGPRRCRDLLRGRGRLRADASRRVARRRDPRRPTSQSPAGSHPGPTTSPKMSPRSFGLTTSTGGCSKPVSECPEPLRVRRDRRGPPAWLVGEGGWGMMWTVAP